MSTQNPGPGYKQHPDHRVDLKPITADVRVEALGQTIAQSSRAIMVQETRYAPVVYIPCSDVNFALLQENAEQTYCPFKGTARYWNIRIGNDTIGNAVWGYDQPYDEVSDLAGHVAFYKDRVDAIYLDNQAT